MRLAESRKKIVCLGGGTGVSVVLSGFKKYPIELTAIVTMFDSGGSSGKLRKELGILPLGDIRQCLTTLSGKRELIPILHYRFAKGGLRGHNLGNLLMAALIEIEGGLEGAIDKMTKILNVKGKIIPVTAESADIVATLKNNQRVKGEEKIINCRYLSKVGLKKLSLEPKVKANPEAISAIKKADLIVFAPGKFYTSILPNLLVGGIPEAVRSSRAKKVFVCNLMTQIGNTDNFKVENFVKILQEYLGQNVIDYVIFNTGKLPEKELKEVKRVFPGAEFIKYDKALLKKKSFVGGNLLNGIIKKPNPADALVKKVNQRTMVLHDPKKLAKIIFNLCRQY